MTALTEIRTARIDDLEKILQLEQSFSRDPSHHAKPEQFISRIEKFSDGFYLGFYHDHLVTMLATYPVHYDPNNISQFTSWSHITNNGYYHDNIADNANSLYIVTGVIDRNHRSQSYMCHAIDPLTQLAKKLGYDFIIAGATFLGYSRYCSKYGFVPAKEYATLTRRGRSFDPLIELYRKVGFSLPGQDHVIADYYKHDGSFNYAALMVYEINKSSKKTIIDFDDENFIAHPYPTYHKVRLEQPVYSNEQGIYYLTRYSDVEKTMQDRNYTRQPKKNASIMADVANPHDEVEHFLRQWLVFQDPPEHTINREYIAKSLKLSTFSSYTSQVNALANQFAQSLKQKKQFDVVTDFALPFSYQNVCQLFGLQFEHIPLLQQLNDALAYAGDHANPQDLIQISPVIEKFMEILSEIIPQKSQQPQNDWLSYMLEENQKLSEPKTMQESISLMIFMIQASSDNPKNSISVALYALLSQRHKWIELCNQPELLDNAIEELIRLETPANKISRWTTCDLTIGNTHIPKNSLVVSLLNAANRDSEIYTFPDEIHFNRKNKRHVGFGRGIHTCLGKAMARLMLKAALQALITELPNITLTQESAVWRPISSQRYLEKLIVEGK